MKKLKSYSELFPKIKLSNGTTLGQFLSGRTVPLNLNFLTASIILNFSEINSGVTYLSWR
jgi:hypothetical protein